MSKNIRSRNYDRVLVFFILFHKRNHFSPTLRQICAGTGVKSTSHVSLILQYLWKQGKLNCTYRNGKANYSPAEPIPDISNIITNEMARSVRLVSKGMYEPLKV